MAQVEITQEDADKLEEYAPSHLKGPRRTTLQVRYVLGLYFEDCKADLAEDAAPDTKGGG